MSALIRHLAPAASMLAIAVPAHAAGDLLVLRQAGFTVSYRQMSFCAGIYTSHQL